MWSLVRVEAAPSPQGVKEIIRATVNVRSHFGSNAPPDRSIDRETVWVTGAWVSVLSPSCPKVTLQQLSLRMSNLKFVLNGIMMSAASTTLKKALAYRAVELAMKQPADSRSTTYHTRDSKRRGDRQLWPCSREECAHASSDGGDRQKRTTSSTPPMIERAFDMHRPAATYAATASQCAPMSKHMALTSSDTPHAVCDASPTSMEDVTPALGLTDMPSPVIQHAAPAFAVTYAVYPLQ